MKTKKIILWIIFGVLLSLAPLAVEALKEWKGEGNFFEHLVSAELLSVGFCLAGASGADAMTASAPRQNLKIAFGGLSILFAFVLALLYVGFHWDVLQLPKAQTFQIEASCSIGALFFSLFAESLAD